VESLEVCKSDQKQTSFAEKDPRLAPETVLIEEKDISDLKKVLELQERLKEGGELEGIAQAPTCTGLSHSSYRSRILTRE
jgi:hypothetical protein